MKPKSPPRSAAFSLPEILKEVKQTVLVYLTPEGIELMQETPFVRKEGYIACREVYDISDPNYLHLDVRYYKDGSVVPKHAYLAIPHSYVCYLTADGPMHVSKRGERRKQREGGAA
jgi:hypothetical protein